MFISPASTSPAIFALLPIKYRSLSNAFNPLSSIDNVPNPIVNLFNFIHQYTDAAATRQRRPVSVGDDILDMFNDLGDWETTPGSVHKD